MGSDHARARPGAGTHCGDAVYPEGGDDADRAAKRVLDLLENDDMLSDAVRYGCYGDEREEVLGRIAAAIRGTP